MVKVATAKLDSLVNLVGELVITESQVVHDPHLQGEDTEVDRNLIEQLNDPLMHMIRNAVDHGIETADVRVAQGKTPVGVIQLQAWHEGGNILVQLQDDGAGLNRDRILAKAMTQGLVNSGENLTENEIFQLIFEPGFTTAEKVSELSRRGVGMDVVRRNIAQRRAEHPRKAA